MNKELLLKELHFLKDNMSHYILMYEEDLADWTPHNNLRSLFSLVNHISGIPMMTAAILEQLPDECIFPLDEPFMVQHIDTPGLYHFFLDGFKKLETFVNAIPNDEFNTKLIRHPFGEKVTPAKVTFDAITHLYHHRGQLHNYLKELGHLISTDTLFINS